MNEILTIDEVAALLKMTKRQVYELCRERTRARQQFPLPKFKINGNTRFLRSKVEEWLHQLAEAA